MVYLIIAWIPLPNHVSAKIVRPNCILYMYMKVKYRIFVRGQAGVLLPSSGGRLPPALRIDLHHVMYYRSSIIFFLCPPPPMKF